MKKLALIILLLLSLGCRTALAQSSNYRDYVTVQLVADKADRNYPAGAKVTFTVAVMKDTYPQKNMKVSYEWGEDMLPAKVKGTLDTGDGYRTLKLDGMKRPGFMTLKASVEVDGRTYSNYTTVGFEPEKIVSTTQMPDDFVEFWTKTIADARKVELKPEMTLMPQYCTSHSNVYHIRFQNLRNGSYIYGMLAMPKAEGVYPAVLCVPGAGVRPYKGDLNFAERDVISLQIGIHGIPVNMDQSVYDNLRATALFQYWTYNYDDRDKHYYKGVYVACIKALDFLCTLPQVDKERLAVCGGSQGGALSLVTAGLDSRIKYYFAHYPALSQIGGYYKGTTGGWPHILKNRDEPGIEQKIKVSEYYDVVNFARLVKAEGSFTFGYNDRVCPPTSTYAAYNAVTAPKTLFLPLDCAHWLYGEHYRRSNDWLIGKLKQ